MSTTYNYGTGRRKSSAARVFLKSGGGKIEINGRSLEDFFGGRWNNALDHTLAQETPWSAREPRAAETVARSILHHFASAPAG